jgi:hypothetical protein
MRCRIKRDSTQTTHVLVFGSVSKEYYREDAWCGPLFVSQPLGVLIPTSIPSRPSGPELEPDERGRLAGPDTEHGMDHGAIH